MRGTKANLLDGMYFFLVAHAHDLFQLPHSHLLVFRQLETLVCHSGLKWALLKQGGCAQARSALMQGRFFPS